MLRALCFVSPFLFILIHSANAEVELSEEELVGKWCLETLGDGAKAEKENSNYEFLPGGKLRYQVSKHSNKMGDGSYKIKGNELSLKPTRKKLTVESISESEMVAKWFLTHHFSKGECSG